MQFELLIIHAKFQDKSNTGLEENIVNVFLIRGAFGKYIARSFFSVTDKQPHSCMVSFLAAICPLCLGINFIIML